MPSSRVIDNHSLIDPVARKYERWMPEYYRTLSLKSTCPHLNQILRPETCLEIIQSVDVYRGLLYYLNQARLTLRS